MPGRNPQEAVDAFLRVLEATTKISVARKGGYRKGVRYAWTPARTSSGMPCA